MPELTLRKIPFTVEADSRLRMLKARTGLDRNYLCRLGFCLSLEEAGIPTVPSEKTPGGREIDRYTLLGEHAQVYISLLLVWMKKHEACELSADDIDAKFIAHMNRGVEIISSRVRSLGDISGLVAC
jgi:DNA sulfur modification protein DndE